MAWRLDENVVRGEIDNRVRGRVIGRIWLAGLAAPLELDLRGNCEADLAGCRLQFENPSPVPISTRPPTSPIRGSAGVLTAGRKVRVFDIPFDEAYALIKAGGRVPAHLANSLHLEWFGDLCGWVVIESADYRMKVSEPVWSFTVEELTERQRLLDDAPDDFAVRVDLENGAENWAEYRCEQLFRESDVIGERYGELLEKYADHPDRDRIIAHEMGWMWLEGSLDADQAANDEGSVQPASVSEDAWAPDRDNDALDPAREGIDWVRDAERGVLHPIVKRAKDAYLALLAETRARERTTQRDNPGAREFLGCLVNLNGKLAGALGSSVPSPAASDPGLVTALLKQAIALLHDAISVSDTLAGNPILPTKRVVHYRAELFAIREEILELAERLRSGE